MTVTLCLLSSTFGTIEMAKSFMADGSLKAWAVVRNACTPTVPPISIQTILECRHLDGSIPMTEMSTSVCASQGPKTWTSIDGSSTPMGRLPAMRRRRIGSPWARPWVRHWKIVGSRVGTLTIGRMDSKSMWMAASMALMPTACGNGLNFLHSIRQYAMREKSGGLMLTTLKSALQRRRPVSLVNACGSLSSLATGEGFLCALSLSLYIYIYIYIYSVFAVSFFNFDLARYSLNPRYERDALMNSRTDHAKQMKLLEAWRINRQLQTRICTELSDVDGIFSNIQRALIEACPTDHHGECLRMKNFSITRIQQICNLERLRVSQRESPQRIGRASQRPWCDWWFAIASLQLGAFGWRDQWDFAHPRYDTGQDQWNCKLWIWRAPGPWKKALWPRSLLHGSKLQKSTVFRGKVW